MTSEKLYVLYSTLQCPPKCRSWKLLKRPIKFLLAPFLVQMTDQWVAFCTQAKNISLKQNNFTSYTALSLWNLYKQWSDREPEDKSSCLIKTEHTLYPRNPVIHRGSLHWHISLTVLCYLQRKNTLDWALSCSGQQACCSKILLLQGINGSPNLQHLKAAPMRG